MGQGRAHAYKYAENGFNVVLADRNVENTSERKHTRNGAGKSTLIEIIHFCLGAQVTKNSVFKKWALKMAGHLL